MAINNIMLFHSPWPYSAATTPEHATSNQSVPLSQDESVMLHANVSTTDVCIEIFWKNSMQNFILSTEVQPKGGTHQFSPSYYLGMRDFHICEH